MSIIDDLKNHKAKRCNTHEATDYIDRVVFERALKDIGIDQDTINDCLDESPVLWPNFLNYFEAKYKDEK